MIHYHGTPITPYMERMKMAGKHFCVSFANPNDAEWCMSNGQSVMWDNGAFTLYTKEKIPDWNKFYAWVEPRIGHPHWAVVPDVIGGSVDQNMGLIKQWPHPKEFSALVWHMDEPISHLMDLLDFGFSKICFGSSGKYWQVGSDNWARRADEAFNELSKKGSIPWIHMMRGLSICGDKWPFASADSTNVARNFKNHGNEVCPERMARRIDSIQCPIRWTNREPQPSLF